MVKTMTTLVETGRCQNDKPITRENVRYVFFFKPSMLKTCLFMVQILVHFQILTLVLVWFWPTCVCRHKHIRHLSRCLVKNTQFWLQIVPMSCQYYPVLLPLARQEKCLDISLKVRRGYLPSYDKTGCHLTVRPSHHPLHLLT